MRREDRWAAEDYPVPELEAFAAALRREGAAGQPGEDAAVSAYREARLAAAEGPRRRRDDWRPVRRRLGVGLPARAVLGALFAGVVVGGVALAAGTGSLPQPFHRHSDPAHRPDPVPKATGPGPAATTSETPAPSARPHRPVPTAPRTTAPGRAEAGLCKALLHGNRTRHGAAYGRLAAAAGGPASVDAYCAHILFSAAGTSAQPTGPGASQGHGAKAAQGAEKHAKAQSKGGAKGKAAQDKKPQGKKPQGKAAQGKATQSKAAQGKTPQDKAAPGKATHGKAAQGKGEQGGRLPDAR
ncbi:hypothetical protein AB0M87_08525 [Streptomyces sp. NPDC051320]|uniref:hypothetical protein n=1 Tax=Streptomyces sp. NPDC051320 TaxID=3154644 RepID=UPI00342CA0BD